MERFEHGGDIYVHAGVLDFSANLNPCGMPARVREVLRDNVDAYSVYPDPHCQALTDALAAYEGVHREWMQATAGATDAIVRLVQAAKPRRALLVAPCYSGYEQALEQVGCQIVWHDLRREDGFALTKEVLERIDEGIDLVVLANPNNPTGRCVDAGLLGTCLEQARAAGALVALDECFVELTERAGSSALVADNKNLVVIKAYTKTFALAGLRLGYAICSDAELLARMAAAGQPWAVSVPAQLAGVACLGEHDHLERSRRLVAAERARLRASLEECGMAVVPGEANYLLFEGPTGLAEALLARGILVRSCDNYRGLSDRWYRVAVRTPQENDRLMAALQEVCA